jgi:heme-degrading monooxygenase HmoA
MAQFRLEPEAAAEAARIYLDKGVPVVSAFPGNVGCHLLEQIGADATFMACTFWDSKKDAKAYEDSGAAQEVAGLIRHAFVGPPELRSHQSASTTR